MKQPHGPKELGQEACASLGLSDDDQMSRLCPSLPTTHQMHRSDGGAVCYTPWSRAHLAWSSCDCTGMDLATRGQ